MEAASRVRVFLPGVQVFRVVIPAVRGRRALPTSRIQPLVGHCAVNGGVVVASDQTGWEGLQWRTLLDRLVKRGATIEEVTRRAQDAQDDRPPEAAPPVP